MLYASHFADQPHDILSHRAYRCTNSQTRVSPYHVGSRVGVGQFDFGPSPGNVRCMMGYIVDLTIVMHGLFWLKRSVSEDAVDSILKKYAESGNHAKVHNEIRVFVRDATTLRLGHSDHVLEEIICLIKKYCVDPQ